MYIKVLPIYSKRTTNYELLTPDTIAVNNEYSFQFTSSEADIEFDVPEQDYVIKAENIDGETYVTIRMFYDKGDKSFWENTNSERYTKQFQPFNKKGLLRFI
jgi:hypothetical protein